MDVDSEEDQMMQAIALSLGQDVTSAESEVMLIACRVRTIHTIFVVLPACYLSLLFYLIQRVQSCCIASWCAIGWMWSSCE